MAPNWTGSYSIIKVHKKGNYSVKKSKGEALTLKLCAINVKLWQEPTNLENEPLPDWISAQIIDDSEPTVPATPITSKKTKKAKDHEDRPEPPLASEQDSCSDDSEYEGKPPVEIAQCPTTEKFPSVTSRK